MADILPVSTTLDRKQEGSEVSVTFEAQLDQGETLVSIEITEYRPNSGVVVSDAGFSGQYRDSFSLDSDALLVRMRSPQGNEPEFRTYGSWDDLPEPTEADIIQWKAPSSLVTEYWYEVKLVYDFEQTPPSGGGGKATTEPTTERKELIKRYTQEVYGDYTIWANRLRQYVSDSGHRDV